MGNFAYTDCDDRREKQRVEMLDGRVIAMAPQSTNHHFVAGNIYNLFANFLRGKPCTAIADGMNVHLTGKDYVVPDVSVVCNRDMIKKHGVYGAPDLIVEVLSPGTLRRDKGYKKNLYERCGVQELWLVDPKHRAVEVYLLKDGKYEIDNVYVIIPEDEYTLMTDEEKNTVVTTFSPALFPELTIRLEDVFQDMLFE